MAILSHLKLHHNMIFVYNVIQKNEKFKNRIFWKVIQLGTHKSYLRIDSFREQLTPTVLLNI